MILDINGDVNLYYVQTLCMIFFPGAKFAKDNADDPKVPKLHLSISKSDDGSVTASASLQVGKKLVETCESVPFSSEMSVEKQIKIATGKAVFLAGKQMFRCTPPWGILTGVRPSKVATDLLEKGYTPTKAKRVLRDDYLLNPQKAALAVSVAQTEKLVTMLDQTNRCSLYISIPFCPSRCAYCSFVSYTTPRLLSLIDEYLEELKKDLAHTFAMIRDLKLELATIYIGGGTPTILSAKQLESLLKHIYMHTDVSKLEEFTLEGGRPDTITLDKIKVCMAYGVNRISVNPQTLSDDILKQIGRMHTVDEFMKAYSIVQKEGMPNINVDLIAGLPGDNFANFSSSVDRIIDLNPSNITVHTFCVKKAADVLHSGKKVYSRTGGDAAKSVSYAQLKTKFAGYRPYYLYRQKNTVGNLENVGYAKVGAEGLYNIYMMEELHTVFAVGAGAVTKLVYRPDQTCNAEIERVFTPKYPYEYLSRANSVDGTQDPREMLREKAIAFYTKHSIPD